MWSIIKAYKNYRDKHTFLKKIVKYDEKTEILTINKIYKDGHQNVYKFCGSGVVWYKCDTDGTVIKRCSDDISWLLSHWWFIWKHKTDKNFDKYLKKIN